MPADGRWDLIQHLKGSYILGSNVTTDELSQRGLQEKEWWVPRFHVQVHFSPLIV